MPKCHKCGTTKDLELLNPFTNRAFICKTCRRKRTIYIPELHRSRSRQEWDRMAEQINTKIARKHG